MRQTTGDIHNTASTPAMTAAEQLVALLAAHEAPIARYLSRLVGDPELARDLTQDTFLAAFRALPHTPVADPRAWLFRIATNRALAHFRRQKLVRWLPLARLREDDRSLAVAGHGEEVAGDVTVAATLARLDPKDRACLLLHTAGFAAADIAAHLGCSVGAARTRLCRAREAFRRIYGESGREHPEE